MIWAVWVAPNCCGRKIGGFYQEVLMLIYLDLFFKSSTHARIFSSYRYSRDGPSPFTYTRTTMAHHLVVFWLTLSLRCRTVPHGSMMCFVLRFRDVAISENLFVTSFKFTCQVQGNHFTSGRECPRRTTAVSFTDGPITSPETSNYPSATSF